MAFRLRERGGGGGGGFFDDPFGGGFDFGTDASGDPFFDDPLGSLNPTDPGGGFFPSDPFLPAPSRDPYAALGLGTSPVTPTGPTGEPLSPFPPLAGNRNAPSGISPDPGGVQPFPGLFQSEAFLVDFPVGAIPAPVATKTLPPILLIAAALFVAWRLF